MGKLRKDFHLLGSHSDENTNTKSEESDSEENEEKPNPSNDEFEVGKLLAVYYGDPNNVNNKKLHFKIGNAMIDDNATDEGMYDYYWTHALNSDETNARINEYCGYGSGNFSAKCFHYQSQSGSEYGEIDIYNIYTPFCDRSIQKPATGSVKNFDPCSDDYGSSYLNLAEVQEALHAGNTLWGFCAGIGMIDNPTTILPIITHLIENGIRVWIYSDHWVLVVLGLPMLIHN
ncbi:unnamed protein product [Lactuca virosa]|uniref:Uncharacterized protein n=1 Tax=Lactuca virosa TaxID=75947 RepID=A0AAU9NIA8_9ASTR|nr:unnamed protein product [Lactuca virosa]